MYYDFLIDIPDKPRVTTKTAYVEYAYERHYDNTKKATVTKRTTIGKIAESDKSKMYPNENYYKFFTEEQVPNKDRSFNRSSCIRIGSYIIIKKVIEDYGLREYLQSGFDESEMGLFLDLVAYTIISESNVMQHYPDYTYNHPLFTDEMTMYSDSKISSFLKGIAFEHSADFLNAWNAKRSHREQIYISYDSTNKNTEAGDLELAEFGKAKVDTGTSIFNYAIGYDVKNKEPLFYEDYPGSIPDVAQLKYMIDAAKGYGYNKIGVILDRGYFSKENIQYMDKNGYSFVMMLKGQKAAVHSIIKAHKGTFENKRAHHIMEFGVYGITIKRKLYESDEKERYFHLYHSAQKEANEKGDIERKIKRMTEFLSKHQNKNKEFGKDFYKYFDLVYDGGTFLMGTEQAKTIEEELDLCGYFCIITSKKMTAKDAYYLYKSRDGSEKVFRGDKSFLGNRTMRMHSNETTAAKIFIEFVALIIRCKIYSCIHEEVLITDSRPNYMNVVSALKELDKIEMIRKSDGTYRLDHAVTLTQKKILKAFGLTAQNVLNHANEISEQLSGKGTKGKE